ncbi:MAG: phosphonate metabolism protein/1,5-bisphosphokinase (PRPP-forming) PhnN [Pseudomonadota bacterium]
MTETARDPETPGLHAVPPRGGRLILVVGPSGAGKDTLLEGARSAMALPGGPGFARRVVTRPADAGGEAHEPASDAAFDALIAEGAMFVHWRAHGLGYGARADLRARLAAGEDIVLNGSRAAVPSILARWARTGVVSITAPAEIMAARLAARGREDAEAVALRRARVVAPLPRGIPVIEIANDCDVATGIHRLIEAIGAVRALPAQAFGNAPSAAATPMPTPTPAAEGA